jgi:hypothetical protein
MHGQTFVALPLLRVELRSRDAVPVVLTKVQDDTSEIPIVAIEQFSFGSHCARPVEGVDKSPTPWSAHSPFRFRG